MASDDDAGKPAGAGSRAATRSDTRFWGGPRSIGSLLPAVTRPAFRSRSAAGGQIMADWPAIVGPALAAISAPRQLARGTLTLACSGPVALELQHLAAQLMERINAHYGRKMVEQLRFVQGAAPLAAAAAAPRRAAPAAPVEVPDMPDGPLREALAALGGAVAQATRARPASRRLTRTRLPEA